MLYKLLGFNLIILLMCNKTHISILLRKDSLSICNENKLTSSKSALYILITLS